MSSARKRPKKRFFTASQVREDISRYQAKARKFLESAAALDLKADRLSNVGLSEDATYDREQAKKARRSAARIEEKKLPYLKQKLSEIMTPELPGCKTDGSVQS